MNVKEVYSKLLKLDESIQIEVKQGREIVRSVMETICAFSNEPGIVEGYILLGISKDSNGSYYVSGVGDPDRIQMNIATQCSSVFNQPVRPLIHTEIVEGKVIVLIHVQELPAAQKPLFFSSQGLPRGAWRRIGSTDQRCTEDDLKLFYNSSDGFETAIVHDTTADDVDENAIKRYKQLRANVNPMAEELHFDTEDLLISLGCAKKINDGFRLTYVGLLTFGLTASLRRIMPAIRIDYIRINGKEWIEDPVNRFTTIDMRGPLMLLINRIFTTVTDDLPHGFMLEEGKLQAASLGLPSRVLREALVNAIIHRAYTVQSPIQVIRYSNRIEIRNPGFSLKPVEQFSQPGSELRNPFISSIFHETNLAETKGSGISTIGRLMNEVVLSKPRFESSRQSNSFTTTIMLEAIDDATSILLAEMLSSDTAVKKSTKDIGNQRLNTKKTTTKTTTKTIDILAKIIKNPYITVSKLAEMFQISDEGVHYHIRKLTKEGRIVRVGGKGGYWKIIQSK